MSIVFTAGAYVHWGVVSVSVTNLLIVAVMVAVFVLAIVVPFPRDRGADVHPPTVDGRPPS